MKEEKSTHPKSYKELLNCYKSLRFLRNQKKKTEDDFVKYFYLLDQSGIYVRLTYYFRFLKQWYLNKGIKVLQTAIDSVEELPDAYFKQGSLFVLSENFERSEVCFKKSYDILDNLVTWPDNTLNPIIFTPNPHNGNYFDLFVKCTIILNSSYSERGMLIEAHTLNIRLTQFLYQNQDLVEKIEPSLLISHLSQPIIYYNLENNFRSLKDYLNSDELTSLLQKIKNPSDYQDIISIKTDINTLPEAFLSYSTNNSILDWMQKNMTAISQTQTIESVKKIWNNYKPATTSQILHLEMNNLINSIEDSYRKQISLSRINKNDFSKKMEENIKIIEKLQTESPWLIGDKFDLENFKSIQKDYTDFETASIGLLRAFIDISISSFKSTERIPFSYRKKWFFLWLSRQSIRIVFSAIIIGTIISYLFGLFNPNIYWLGAFSVITFLLSELVFEPWIKNRYFPQYKNLVRNLFLEINRNIFTDYNYFVKLRDSIIHILNKSIPEIQE